jgi:hypothetical protein
LNQRYQLGKLLAFRPTPSIWLLDPFPAASRITTGGWPGGRTQVTDPNAAPSCAAAFSALNASVAGFIRQPDARSGTYREHRTRQDPPACRRGAIVGTVDPSAALMISL